ncbi:MAG: hypothetical protein KC766_04145, partial [Myxococcales bacterium]|nr:hypothetical protein [Myxococcales bacterium]
ESKAYAQQRGNISALSVEVKIGYMHRVLCYGVLPDGQRLPGYMDATRQGQLPDKCYVKIMGRGVGLTNWGVFKYKHNPNLPSSNAWWSPGNIKPATSELPLYLLGNRGSEFCRGKPPGQSLYYFPGELVRANGNFFCRMTTLNGFQSVSSFQLYFVPRSSGPRLSPNWADGDHQAWSRGLRVSDGSEAYKRVYRCQQYTTKKFGFVRESDKRCRVPGVNSAAAEQKFKILWTH